MGRLSIFVLIALVAASVRAQDQAPRTGANDVRVDVYATSDGRSVEDLTAADVDLLEDGVLQTVTAFERVSIGSPAAQGTRLGPETAQGNERRRVYVIFLDTLHTPIERSTSLRLPLIKFLDQLITPEDMVALVTPESAVVPVAFGRKAIIISNIMQSDWSWARGGRTGPDEKEALYDACYPPAGNAPGPAPEMKSRRRERLALDALDNLVEHLASIRDARKAILTISDGWVLFRENENLRADPGGRDQGNIVDRLLRRPKEKSEETGGPKEVNRVECDADRVALAALDHTQRLRSLTEDANRANVTFYPIHAGAWATNASDATERGGRNREENVASRQDSLRFIADGTDGLAAIGSGSLETALTRIAADLSSYYLLGYSSSNTRLDGRFRTISVRVKRDGVKVRTRRGYRGPTADELVSSNATAGASAAVPMPLTGQAGINARAPFRIRTSSWLRDSPEQGSRRGAFWIVGELDYQTRRQLAWTAGSHVEVVVLAADGKEVVSRTIELGPGEGPFAIQVPEAGTLAAGEYAVRVRLQSQADAKTEVTSTTRVVLNQSSLLGEAVMWRRGLSTGPQYLRTADPRFMRSDRLRLELATSAKQPASARVLDRKGAELSVPVQVSERPDPSGAFRWVVVDAQLAPFAPGDYSVEVRQGTDRQLTEFRLVP